MLVLGALIIGGSAWTVIGLRDSNRLDDAMIACRAYWNPGNPKAGIPAEWTERQRDANWRCSLMDEQDLLDKFGN